jgi:hypothetical protein
MHIAFATGFMSERVCCSLPAYVQPSLAPGVVNEAQRLFDKGRL